MDDYNNSELLVKSVNVMRDTYNEMEYSDYKIKQLEFELNDLKKAFDSILEEKNRMYSENCSLRERIKIYKRKYKIYRSLLDDLSNKIAKEHLIWAE